MLSCAHSTELAAKHFDSSKELHEYQLNRQLSNISTTKADTSGFNVEEFENSLLKDVKFRATLVGRCALVDQQEAGQVIGGQLTAAPEIVQKPKNIFCYEGDDLTFQVKVSGNPIPRIYWFKNGQALSTSQRCRASYENGVVCLHIHMLMTEDAASYTLLTENQHGIAIFSINLNINIINDENFNHTQHQQIQR